MPTKTPECSICKSPTLPFLRQSTKTLSEAFLDDELRRVLPELKLNQCSMCSSLWAADERQDQSLLLAAYSRIPDSYFGEIQIDPRYDRFYQLLNSLLSQYTKGRRICDVGCGDGSFLGSLGKAWERSGVEPSHQGVESAKRKGLLVNCGTLHSIPELHQFDVITALDVIEHVIDPNAFLIESKKRLAKDGLLMLVTGDPASVSARIAGPHWSYLHWCGHVSVLSRTALNRVLRQNGFEVEVWKRVSHPASAGALAWNRVLILEPFRRLLGRNPSQYPFWNDHQIVLAKAIS